MQIFHVEVDDAGVSITDSDSSNLVKLLHCVNFVYEANKKKYMYQEWSISSVKPETNSL